MQAALWPLSGSKLEEMGENGLVSGASSASVTHCPRGRARGKAGSKVRSSQARSSFAARDVVSVMALLVQERNPSLDWFIQKWIFY